MTWNPIHLKMYNLDYPSQENNDCQTVKPCCQTTYIQHSNQTKWFKLICPVIHSHSPLSLTYLNTSIYEMIRVTTSERGGGKITVLCSGWLYHFTDSYNCYFLIYFGARLHWLLMRQCAASSFSECTSNSTRWNSRSCAVGRSLGLWRTHIWVNSCQTSRSRSATVLLYHHWYSV